MTFGSVFGPDPYTSLSIVESLFYDGMEYDGYFFLAAIITLPRMGQY